MNSAAFWNIPRRLLVVFVSFACTPLFLLSADVSPEQVEFFESRIRPILVERCYSCHDSTGKKLKGGLALNSPSGLLKGGDSGPALVPAAPDESLLIEAIRYQNRDLQMPPKSPLPPEEIRFLEEWVAMGAPDPRSDNEVDSPAITMPSLEEGRAFWSFQKREPIPLSSEIEGNTHPVDQFLNAKLADSTLDVAEPASDPSWLRRVTFGLTGLPPTPDEVEWFTSSESPDKDAEVIDRLLASPHYGVRWGRHWLDVARYADSNGLDENLAFGNAWRYRDYVIAAFNHDKPFDRFLVEQIAGDLITEPTEETLTATGFLALGARVLAEKDEEKRAMDVIDEQIDTMGKAFLGMTLGCARCHDHKFDPITQADYYSLAAIFRSSVHFADTKTGAIGHWFEHSLENDDKEALAEWDQRIADAKKKPKTFKSETTVRLRGQAREKAADYLVAATRLQVDDTLDTVSLVAEPLGLHPRILHHSRRHLQFHPDDPAFARWQAFMANPGSDDTSKLRQFYQERFEEAQAYQTAKDKKTGFSEDVADFHAALFDNAGFLAVPAKPAHAFSPEHLAEYRKLEEKARLLESEAPDHPAVMGIADAEEIMTELPIHIRGSHLNLGKPVPRALPAVFGMTETNFPEDASGRLELAQWMANPSHPLTARVIVNRVWRWHFGQGLVKTTENFGFLGDQASHPELLDWLANWFVENDWSIKQLNRLIMTSEAYRRSTLPPSGAWTTADPENELLSFFPVNRLEAEAIRDAVLAISGRLDDSIGGKTIPLRNRQMVFNHTSKDHTTYDSTRRSAFLPIVRNHVYDWFHLFDYPDPATPTGNRGSTVIAPQALLLMNSPLAQQSAKALADLLRQQRGPPDTAIHLAWLKVYNRPPSVDEVAQALKFLKAQPDRDAGWELFCQALFASNEFLYLQ